MKKILLYLILIQILFTACSNKENFENATEFNLNSFINSQDLKGRILNFDSLVMRPSGILVVDSILITIEPSSNKLFQLFNLKTCKEIGKRINKGQGPKDMIRPRFLGYDNNIIKIVDMATSVIFEFNYIDFINNADPLPINRFKLSSQVFIDAEITQDYVIGYFDDKYFQLKVFDLNGKEVENISPYPTSSIPFTEMEKKEAYYMNFTTNGKDKIALCYYLTDLIEIYSLDGVLLKRIHGPEQFISLTKEYQDGNVSGSSPLKNSAKDAFFSPEKSDNGFFVLYNGRLIDEHNHSSSCKQLFSFSWDGIPQTIYNLDDPIFAYSIDLNNKKLYGISQSPEFHIVEYSYK